jgi:hypothetical protein
MAMAKDLLIIEIDPDSELGHALDEAGESPIVLKINGARFRVTQEPDDLWANYDRERVREGLRKFAGMITPEEADRIKELIRP